jgi:tRNA(Ile)-lysidine synthase
MMGRVKSTIKRYGLINRNDKIVIGVSGGPDSVALLYILNSLKKELKISLHIAHLDHMLRSDSHKDREFTEALAQKLNLPITSAQINVKELVKGGSLEEVARNARLGFFFKVAKDTKANKIALGHNLDDQAETVLMRILRGTGLYGLSGILPRREISGFQIIRPLIEVRRKDIESFLRRRGLKGRIDASNRKDIYFRNRIRNKLIPYLEEGYSRDIKGVLSNLAQNAGVDYDYLNLQAHKTLKRLAPRLDVNKIQRMHPAMRRLLFRIKIATIQGNTRRITFQHIKEIEDLLFNRPPNSIVNLPKGVSVLKKKNTLSFYRKKS